MQELEQMRLGQGHIHIHPRIGGTTRRQLLLQCVRHHPGLVGLESGRDSGRNKGGDKGEGEGRDKGDNEGEGGDTDEDEVEW